MIRDDLSDKLIHFTKDTETGSASDNFYSIISQKRILGGSGYIKGGYKCICFTESPIAKFPYVFSDPDFKYSPLGFMIDKVWLYEKGGRPVIYQSKEEYELLTEKQKYRHKTYNPLPSNNYSDFTWEREWRIHTDELILDPEKTTLIVPNRKWVEKFKNDNLHEVREKTMVFGGRAWFMINNLPWHFIALEDLGVKINI